MSDPLSAASDELLIHREGHIATVELNRPPHNFFDQSFLAALADIFEALQAEPEVRAIVLAARGKSFCAGADVSAPQAAAGNRRDPRALYEQAIRLFVPPKPIVAAVQGPAIGGGLGLALVADFRVASVEARFSANFTRLGFHPGFGLSYTLPRLVGPQHAARLFFTGQRIDGERALRIGLVDELVPQAELLARAQALAAEVAASAPIAVESVRATLRAGLMDSIRAAIEREAAEQCLHSRTADFREGVAAAAQRREPAFGRH